MDEVGGHTKRYGFSSIVHIYCPFMHMPIIGMGNADNWFMPIIDIVRYVASYRLCFDCWLNHKFQIMHTHCWATGHGVKDN